MLAHRRDIDGLRTLAVLPVILFHAKIPGFSGGYVGVDIFFVISGYLITGLLLREYQDGHFSILSFYDRRIRRILPALGFMLLIVTILAATLMLPSRLINYSHNLASAALSISNIWFWRSADYFAPSSELNPLLHTWSLGVEEQFYVVLPLIIWAVIRLGWQRNIRWLFAAMAVLSLALAELTVHADPVAAFYLLPTRSWELLLGSVLAASGTWKLSRRWAEVAVWAGVAMIAATVFLYDEQVLFPGVSALLPCFGAALVIQIGRNQQTSASALLSHPAPAFIGLISYSLYLWHWPLLVLPRIYLLRELTPLEVMLSLAVTFAMSVISWRYIEQPIRRRTLKFPTLSPAASSIAAAVAGIFVLIAGAGALSTGLPDRVPDEVERLDAITRVRLDEIVCDRANESTKEQDCDEFAGGPTKVMLWGDSHAMHYAPSLETYAAKHGVLLELQATPGCAPLLDVQQVESDGRVGDACFANNKHVMDMLMTDKRVRAVVIAGRWTRFFFAEGDNDLHHLRALNGETDPAKIISQSLAATAEKLSARGIRVLILGSSPEFDRLLPACLARTEWLHWPETRCSFKAGTLPGNPADKLMQKLAASGISARILRAYDALCPQSQCLRKIGATPLTIDTDHLSPAAADQVFKVLGVDRLLSEQKISGAAGPTMLR
ncbi:MAG: acyltransferase family protein [Hyphomonadaceae bacterium]